MDTRRGTEPFERAAGVRRLRGIRIVTIVLNGERRELPCGLNVAELLGRLGVRSEHVAVERNRELVARARHAETIIAEGDELEVVTLVGGGAPTGETDEFAPEPLVIGSHKLRSRLLVGTGKYTTLELMRDCLAA